MKIKPASVTIAEEEQSHFTSGSYPCQWKRPERTVEYSGTGFMGEMLKAEGINLELRNSGMRDVKSKAFPTA
jgi:hypothetical protein